MPTDFSEISAAAALLRGIRDPAAAPAAAPAPAPPAVAPLAPVEPGVEETHQKRLERELTAVCHRTGATAGLVADGDGFPLASVGPGGAGDAAPVSAAVLGDAAIRAQHVLGAEGDPQVSVRLGDGERLVLRRFSCGGRSFNLLLRLPDRAPEPGPLGAVTARLAEVIGQEPAGGGEAP